MTSATPGEDIIEVRGNAEDSCGLGGDDELPALYTKLKCIEIVIL